MILFEIVEMFCAFELFNLLSKVFPDNQILILPRDVELGVVKNE